MSDTDNGYSIVEYMNDHSGYRCGYCKANDTNYSHGMWAHQLSVDNYQDLIDRGWRRSGKYCYKPMMNKTCCPQYTIKCDALNFKLSKSQKKVLKRMHSYLSHGNVKKSDTPNSDVHLEGVESYEHVEPKKEVKNDLSSYKISVSKIPEEVRELRASSSSQNNVKEDFKPVKNDSQNPTLNFKESTKSWHSFKPGCGVDVTKPPCKKAKLLRRERFAAKLSSCKEISTNKLKKSNDPKSIEDFLSEPLPENPAHRLEMRLLLALPTDKEYNDTFDTSHLVFEKYQMEIHGDPKEKCVQSKYRRFLCNSSLQPWKPSSGPPQGYGPFHQQYWLDGQLIAVGVIDILPYCVSSVYLYYDPKYSFLSLGTYSSLREIALTRELNRVTQRLKWYYMGFYIHSCPKMRYKGNYNPSFLLCPQTYSWNAIERCLPKLNISKYSRLNEDVNDTGVENVDIKRVLCLHKGEPILYGMLSLRRKAEADDENEVKEYATLVGSKCAYSMLLYKG